MVADWEVEIGGDAPVIEAHWPGFVDLCKSPERVAEIAETITFPPLASLLRSLNAPGSPVWTSKCDVWEPEPGAVAIYIDMLPREGTVFAEWQQAEVFCREFVPRLTPLATDDCGADLVIRQASAGETVGFGITAYLSASAIDAPQAARLLVAAMAGFAEALPTSGPPAMPGSTLQ